MPNDMRHWDACYQAVTKSTWGANKAALAAYANGRPISDDIRARCGSYAQASGRKPDVWWDDFPPKKEKNTMTNQTNDQINLLTEIRDLLLLQAANIAPNYRYDLNEYPSFDWSAINATVTKSDSSGAAVVRFANHLWTRRSATGKYGKAIWFSRPNGKDESGDTLYLRLVTFKPIDDAESIAFQVATKPPASPPRAAQQTAVSPPAKTPALAVNQRVKVQGKNATKWGIIKELFQNGNIRVQIGQQLITVNPTSLQVA